MSEILYPTKFVIEPERWKFTRNKCSVCFIENNAKMDIAKYTV